jgi:hypothetical protein
MLSVADLSALLGVPVGTIYDWRTRGRGPVAHTIAGAAASLLVSRERLSVTGSVATEHRIGKHLRYNMSDVTAWMATQREDAKPGMSRDTVPPIRLHGPGGGSDTVVRIPHHRATSGSVIKGVAR